MTNQRPTQLITGEVRISYEHLLKPSVNSNRPNDEPKYSATLLIPKSDMATKQKIDAAIQAAIQDGIQNRWGGVKPAQVPIPIHDGDGVRESGEPYGPECKGCWVMTASSKQRQDIVDANLNPIMDSTEIYSGIYALVVINFFAYNSAGKKGIGCGLGPVKKTRDGEPLGGRVTAADAFGGQTYNPGVQPPAGGYSQPPYQAYPQQQQPQYAPPQQPYAPPAPQQPQAAPPWQAPAYPGQQQPQQPAGPIDPITGQPLGNVSGGVMGL
jgi:hypothetical protein